MNNMSNEELVREIMNQCKKACEKFTFNHDYLKDQGKLRKPNTKEGKQWLIRELRSIYFGESFMKRSTYYSLKGEVRHWSLIPVFNYLRKRGYGEIEKRFEEYMNSKVIAEYKIKVTSPTPVKRCVIDIDVKPLTQKEEDNKNE